MSISALSSELITDPLHSPFPIPWQWILETQAAVAEGRHAGSTVYRSPYLYDPQRRFAAYCRVRLQLKPKLHESRVTSILFVEDLQTGMLHTVMARSPLAPHPFQAEEIVDAPGIISILLPVSWSADGERLLGRQFEGFLGSGAMSDFAVVWEQGTQTTTTLAPSSDIDYTHAILLGWSEQRPEQVLFQAGCMGDEVWHLWTVAMDGTTAIADGDHGMVFGELSSNIWTGNDPTANGKFNI